ncbi:MAG: 2-oxoacid:acceptor oxidoreductase family protein [bacterium]|jgi:pyruvate ferredoxin oxidoreductase gamma subunit
MSSMLEIRWHGRGGQGAKTAAQLLAEAAAAAGKFIQGFPEYGPERMGAPVQAFTRISDQPIQVHCHVTEPSIVVVLDPTLLRGGDVTSGMPTGGLVLINSDQRPDVIKKALPSQSHRVYTVNASLIAEETIGRPIPNTPLLGALIRVTNIMSLDQLLEDTEKKLARKFPDRPQIVTGNLEAVRRAHEEVQGE